MILSNVVLLNISGAFIFSDFQLPFVLKVFPTSHSLILLIPIFTKYTITPNILSYELLIILQKCNRGFETYAARSMLKLALLFYNATPPPTDFPD